MPAQTSNDRNSAFSDAVAVQQYSRTEVMCPHIGVDCAAFADIPGLKMGLSTAS
jgi:hypothetical protein